MVLGFLTRTENYYQPTGTEVSWTFSKTTANATPSYILLLSFVPSLCYTAFVGCLFYDVGILAPITDSLSFGGMVLVRPPSR